MKSGSAHGWRNRRNSYGNEYGNVFGNGYENHRRNSFIERGPSFLTKTEATVMPSLPVVAVSIEGRIPLTTDEKNQPEDETVIQKIQGRFGMSSISSL